MVRTKADSVPGAYRKAVAAQAPRKSLGASSSANSSNAAQPGTPAKGKYAGGNPVFVRPTPTWQKGIGTFFGGGPVPEKENELPEKENELPAPVAVVEDGEEAGGSGVSKSSRKSRPLAIEDEDAE